MTDCLENKVHDAFKENCSDKTALLNRVGDLCSKHGKDVVFHAMVECLVVAYLRLKYRE